MNTVHRQFGKLKRRGGDQANVAMLLNEYEDADKMLTKVCLPRLPNSDALWNLADSTRR
jgi:hypothetical protein